MTKSRSTGSVLGVTAVIPARWASSRLPGKPLADIGGQTMIERVYWRVRSAALVSRAIVATDDPRIADVIGACGGEALLTGNFRNGTERVAYVSERIAGPILNVQGDLPFVNPDHIDTLAHALALGSSIATLASPLSGDPVAPEVVKVVLRADGRALYFSRAPIPLRGPYLHHVGVYGFGEGVLSRIGQLPKSNLEDSEGLEQLRWLAGGFDIDVVVVDHAEAGVDTLEQLEAARARFTQIEG